MKEKQKLEKIKIAQDLFNSGKKFCKLCANIKLLEEFYSDISLPDKHSRYCKICVIKRHVNPRREKIRETVKLYQKLNPEKIKLSRKKDKSKTHNKIMKNIKTRIKEYLESQSISSRKVIGCHPKELVTHIENQFSSEMNWCNRGSIWELIISYLAPHLIIIKNLI